MKRILQVFVLVAVSATVAHAQAPGPSNPCNASTVNTAYLDNMNNVQYLCTTAGWKANIGIGAPTIGCSTINYGAGYTGIGNNVQYQCAQGGWFAGSSGGGSGGSVTQFLAPGGSWPTWLVPTVTNSTTTPSLAVAASAIPNSALANASITLGSTNIPLGTIVSTAAGFNAPTATALAATPTLCGTGNAPTGILANGNATGCQAIAGGGGGATLQTNSVNNSSQTLLNATTSSSIAFTNPSGGILSAALVSGGASTLAGFNASNVYTGFTIGSGLGIVGGALTNTSPATAGISGTASTGNIPVGTGTNTVGNSQLSDSGTTLTYAGTGGVATTGTTPTAISLGAGTGSVPALGANTSGFVAADATFTAYRFKLPTTPQAGLLYSAAPVTRDGVNEAVLGFQSPEFPLTVVPGNYASYTAGTTFVRMKMQNAGHVANVKVTNYSTSSCATAPTFNVYDFTTSTAGSSATTGSTGAGTIQGVDVDNPTPGLTFSAGDTVGVFIVSAGCTNFFGVTAVVQEP